VIARLRDLRARMSAVLSPFFVPTDADIRLAERLAVAEEVINDFDECVGRQKFGTFLRGFCLDRERLGDALYEARTRGVAAEEETSTAMEPTSVKRRGLLDGVTGRQPTVVVAVAVPQDDGVGKRTQAGPAPSIIGGRPRSTMPVLTYHWKAQACALSTRQGGS